VSVSERGACRPNGKTDENVVNVVAMTNQESVVRAINLVEVLTEDLEDEGFDVESLNLPSAMTEQPWSDERIRAYFDAVRRGETPTPTPTPNESLPPSLAHPSKELFEKWFPGLARSGTATDSPSRLIVCFPNAGNAEDMYTSEGSGARKQPSPLLEYCREHNVQMLAPQYPGRAMRLKDDRVTTAQGMAEALFEVLAPTLVDSKVPWVLLAHSVGTWISYEFLLLCKARAVPMPSRAFISAMPSPDIPMASRPWRQQKDLDEAAFKEECRAWDISEVVFSAAMWPMYQPLLRADFTMFDEYPEGRVRRVEKFDFPIQSFWGTRDRRVSEAMVMGWANVTSGTFRIEEVDGNHLWPLDASAKKAWLGRVVELLLDDDE